jgi:predicted molibdopterin-dependent oxidoreductase YjgC
VLFELLGQPDGAPWTVWAELNPETGRALGIASGAKVRIASAVGSIEAAAMLVDRTPPDVVAVAFVPALHAGGRWARLMSADVRRLFDATGRAAMRVRVTPKDGARRGSGRSAAKEI